MAVPPATFDFDPGYPSDVECSVCLCPWTHPIEVNRCGHIFCRDCLAPCTTCPTCRGNCADTIEPNRVIRNIVNGLPGHCTRCRWRGSRELYVAVHTVAACDTILEAAARAATEAQSAARGERTPPPPARQASSDVLSCPDSASNFMAFFQSARGTPRSAPHGPTTANSTSASGGGGAGGPLDATEPARDVTPPPPPAQPQPQQQVPSDNVSSPQFSTDVTLAVAVIRTVDGAAPPLDFHTVTAPLHELCVNAIMRTVCPDVLRPPGSGGGGDGAYDDEDDERAASAFAAPVAAAIAGDLVLPSLEMPLASYGIEHGAFLYLLCGALQHDPKAVELFRVRSAVDGLTRQARVMEASPAAAGDLAALSARLGLLTSRLDSLDGLAHPLRQLRRRTCADVGYVEEVLDRLRASRTPSSSVAAQGENASFNVSPPPRGAAGGGSGRMVQASQAMADEPWLMYNLSQRFYDSLFAAFAQFDEDGRGVLNRQQATRLCKWMNLPSDPRTVDDLFTTFCGPSALHVIAATERLVSFHQLCVWVQRHQRRPLHDYGLTFERYYAALDAFHHLDRAKRGALDPAASEAFLVEFAGMQAPAAASLVDRILVQMRALVARVAAPGAPSLAARSSTTGTGDPSQAANSVRAWAAEFDEGILIDILLRVLCSEEQGWDVCDADEDGVAAPDDGAAAAESAATAAATGAAAGGGGGAAPRQTPFGFFARRRAATAARRMAAAASATGPSPGPSNGAATATLPNAPDAGARHHRLRARTTTTNAGLRGSSSEEGRKDKDCVVM